MHTVVHGERMLTDLDFARLMKLVNERGPSPFSEMLDGVDVTSPRDIPADVVTMYSRIECADVHTSRRQVLTVCYPGDAQPAAGCISVLSPVGSSLLGLKVGDVARWLTPSGEHCAAEIVAIHYQPESSGDYTR
ncbi:GreA/GreB family elongation factor [Paracidovorax valerianellae]|uniref:Regulator of nucleoside diphosphate kinase n=1 Tax=Paracidovorax valerianellae TaxID=187868 RepID=A0A1G7B0E4_9BURK|nr:GreA/GreB family elongation factor [Paracidovorax valerianellae]MDA8445663.1 GreA/GreB family elongation factor [Paracidovorax valerianellae]SDE20317.1 regulator of nucleoside diphosphate kinase [Paracidovorax valerianellae]